MNNPLSLPSARPFAPRDFLAWVLGPIVNALISARVSANAITGASLACGVIAGGLLAFGCFGLASVAVVVASLGDGLDGLVARKTKTASGGGALFDAAVDRYEEFFILGGLAIYFHASTLFLALILFALLGSFMVSYGSAKAEALGVAVPSGIMRRAERAVCLSVGLMLVPVAGALTTHFSLSPWVTHAPILAAVTVVAILANASAIARFRAVAQASSSPAKKKRAPSRVSDHAIIADAE